jgi:ankyrin repeat protein
VLRLVDAGADINEVEAAGNTPLHSAAFEGWAEGVELLLQLGAKVSDTWFAEHSIIVCNSCSTVLDV